MKAGGENGESLDDHGHLIGHERCLWDASISAIYKGAPVICWPVTRCLSQLSGSLNSSQTANT